MVDTGANQLSNYEARCIGIQVRLIHHLSLYSNQANHVTAVKVANSSTTLPNKSPPTSPTLLTLVSIHISLPFCHHLVHPLTLLTFALPLLLYRSPLLLPSSLPPSSTTTANHSQW